jgi:hypothetical protein
VFVASVAVAAVDHQLPGNSSSSQADATSGRSVITTKAVLPTPPGPLSSTSVEALSVRQGFIQCTYLCGPIGEMGGGAG